MFAGQSAFVVGSFSSSPVRFYCSLSVCSHHSNLHEALKASFKSSQTFSSDLNIFHILCAATVMSWSNNQEFSSSLSKEKLNTDSMLSNKIEIFINRIWTKHVKECSWRYAGGLISCYIQQDLTVTPYSKLLVLMNFKTEVKRNSSSWAF